jgi:gliding motility-associated-like protein
LSANVLRYLERQNFHSNGDGYNDYWNVKGWMPVLHQFHYIYIRPLRKINKINTNSDGWDGTFNGNPPSDDYWYTAKLQDGREKLRDTSA